MWFETSGSHEQVHDKKQPIIKDSSKIVVQRSKEDIAQLKTTIQRRDDIPAFNPEITADAIVMGWISLCLIGVSPLSYVGGVATLAMGYDQVDNIILTFSERNNIQKQSMNPETFKSLVADLKTLDKNTLQQLWLWDKFLWLDKGIEVDTSKMMVRLDFAGKSEGFIYKDDKNKYHLVVIGKPVYHKNYDDRSHHGEQMTGSGMLTERTKSVYHIEWENLIEVLEWVQKIPKSYV